MSYNGPKIDLNDDRDRFTCEECKEAGLLCETDQSDNEARDLCWGCHDAEFEAEPLGPDFGRAELEEARRSVA